MQLISFLGRVPKNENGYRTTIYEFSDGSKTEPISFIGLSLIQRIKPKKLIILGTSGSMWDHLLQTADYKPDEDLYLELIDQVEKKQVTQELLNKIKNIFQYYHGIPVELVIIPYGQSMDEQIQIMEIIAQHVPDHSEVTLDVTHGFRHLPMLGIIAAQYLERLKQVEICNIFYGMYDPDLKVGEVYDLQGMLQLNNWVFALSQFDKDGDYSVFAKPLTNDGFSIKGVKALEKAAYFERIFNVSQAKQQLSTFSMNIENTLPNAGKLFTNALNERIKWAKSSNLLEHQRKLAHFYLDNGDYVRAAIFGVEAYITSLFKQDELDQCHIFQKRKNVEDDYYNGRNQRGKASWLEDYRYLKGIRNALAHGTAPDEEFEKTELNKAIARKSNEVMVSDETLNPYLRSLFKKLVI